LPPSFQQTVYERVTMESDLSYFLKMIDIAMLGSIIDRISPVTVFGATNTAWTTYNVGEQRNDTAGLAENHIFEGLLSSDMLLEMDGQSIKSMNDKDFLITVVNGSVVLRGVGVYAEMTKATVLKADILGSTGVLHLIDGVLHDTPSPATPLAVASITLAPGEMTLESIAPSETEIPEETTLASIAPSDTEVPEETASPREETATPSDEKSMESAAPSSVSSESESIEFTLVDEAFLSFNDTTMLDELQEVSAPSEDMVLNATNTTNATFAPPVGEGDEDLGTMFMEPSLSPVTLIDVEADADTDAPTEAPLLTTASDAEVSDNGEQTAVGDGGEQIAVGNTASGAPPQYPTRLTSSLVVIATSSLMVWQLGVSP